MEQEKSEKDAIMAHRETNPSEQTLPFLRVNERPPKPRTVGVTEIRGPYYTALGKLKPSSAQPVDDISFTPRLRSLSENSALWLSVRSLCLCGEHFL